MNTVDNTTLAVISALRFANDGGMGMKEVAERANIDQSVALQTLHHLRNEDVAMELPNGRFALTGFGAMVYPTACHESTKSQSQSGDSQ